MLGIKSKLSFHGSQILHVLALTTPPASPRPFLSLIIQPLLYFFEVCKHNRFSPASWPFYMGHSLSTLQMTRSCLSFSSHLKFYFLGEDFFDYPVKCRIVHSCLNLRLLFLSSVSLSLRPKGQESRIPVSEGSRRWLSQLKQRANLPFLFYSDPQ